MIKWTIVFSLVFIAFIKADDAPDREALHKFIHDAVSDCYEDDEKTIKVEVTDAAFESLITSDPSPPRSTKCMRYCVMKAHNLYNDDETLNITEMQKLFKKVYPDFMDDEKLEAVADLGEKCVAEATGEDRCEKAHEAAMCMISKLADIGINIKQV